jgi:hypothetical protein
MVRDQRWACILYLSPFMLPSCPSLIRPSCFVKKRCLLRPVHPIFRYISSLWTLGLTHISPFSIHFITMSSTAVRAPDLDLPVGHCLRFIVNIRILRLPFQYPDRPEVITDNLLKLTELAPDPCVHLLYLSFHFYTLKRSGEPCWAGAPGSSSRISSASSMSSSLRQSAFLC